MSVQIPDSVFPSGKIAALGTPLQFGAWVRQRRKVLDLTQEELALLVDVGPRFIAELEAGKSTCQLGKALAVASALGGRLTDGAEASGEPAPPSAAGTP